MSTHNIKLNKCIVEGCNRLLDETFYDKSPHRPLCSRKCRDIYYNKCNFRNKSAYKDRSNIEIKEPKYEYYMRGKLSLVNFKL